MLLKPFYIYGQPGKGACRNFFNHLKELAGETIVVDGGYPVDIYPDIKQLLLSAQHNEYEGI